MFANLTSPGITKELDQLWGECLACSHHRKQTKNKIFFSVSGKDDYYSLIYYIIASIYTLFLLFSSYFWKALITEYIKKLYMPVDTWRALNQKRFFSEYNKDFPAA